MQLDKDNTDSESELTQKTRKRRRLLKKIIRNNRQIASDKEFEILINLDKELFAGYNAHRLGNFCIQQNRLELAQQNLIKANDLVQKKFIFTNVYLSLGNLYLKKKIPEKASEYYEKVIAESPHKNSKVYLNKDQVAFATRLNSFNAYSEAHGHLIKIYLESNQLQKAYAVCKASLELKQEEESCILSFADAMEKMLGSKSEAMAFAWKKLVEETVAKGYDELVNFKRVQVNSWAKPTDPYQGARKISVTCLKWGSKYSAEHVNKLYAGVKRNTSWQVDFYCFTDDSLGINKNIKVKLIDDEWKKEWGKALIFGVEIEGKKCYIDLDVVVVGRLDELFEYTGDFGSFYGPDKEDEGSAHFGYRSSVVLWNGDALRPIYDGIKGNFQLIDRLLVRFDSWLDLAVDNGDDLQKFYPQKIIDFKKQTHTELPKTCSIVHFPKKHKPQDYPVDWVKQLWTQL